MSFSSKVKEELSKLTNLANKQIVKYEILGYLSTGSAVLEKNKLKFATENEYNINRFSKLINNLQYQNYEIEMIGKKFCITLNEKLELPEVSYQNNEIVLNKEMLEDTIKKDEMLAKAFVRGCFLGGGSIANPKNTYHLEIHFSEAKNIAIIEDILTYYEITFGEMKKSKNYSLYMKDGDEISKFLALIGASRSVLHFEEIRVYRDIRNQVNRKVNCETANLNKTVNAALQQIENIQYLQSIGKLETLSEPLQEIAKVRLENPEASLAELGNMLAKPIGKSGVNHRFQAIERIVEELKEKN